VVALGNRSWARKDSSCFSQLGLSPTACVSLIRLGYETPTPIQTEAIPLVLSGVDLLARAQTGTGKTAAFGLPMIERLLARESSAVGRMPAGLVLVPTRELAVQVHQALSSYAASTPLRLAAIFGGVAINRQVQVLRRGVDIVVATPGRLLDHLQRRTIDLSAVDVLTLDEADRMLDLGFLPALKRIVATLPRRRQTLLFSATLSDAIVGLSAEFTRDAVRLEVSPRQVFATTVTHQAYERVAVWHRQNRDRRVSESAPAHVKVHTADLVSIRRGQHRRHGTYAGTRGYRTDGRRPISVDRLSGL
jgi:ATP-dependent RNA helicase RhlE